MLIVCLLYPHGLVCSWFFVCFSIAHMQLFSAARVSCSIDVKTFFYVFFIIFDHVFTFF